MPSRNKSLSPSTKEEAALATKRKTTAPNTATPSKVTAASAPELALTAEEKVFLSNQLALMKKGSPPSSKEGKDMWITTTLPTLVTIVEKVLKMCAEHYAISYQQTQNEAAAGTDGKEGGGTMEISSTTISNVNSHTAGPNTAASIASAAGATTTSAGTPTQFMEENDYLVRQLSQQQWTPFTYQRVLEILSDPKQYHTSSKSGRLRAYALQTSLRKCLLVTYPLNTSDTTC